MVNGQAPRDYKFELEDYFDVDSDDELEVMPPALDIPPNNEYLPVGAPQQVANPVNPANIPTDAEVYGDGYNE